MKEKLRNPESNTESTDTSKASPTKEKNKEEDDDEDIFTPEETNSNDKKQYLFNSNQPLLKVKPKKEQAVIRFHEAFKQGQNLLHNFFDPLTQQSSTQSKTSVSTSSTQETVQDSSKIKQGVNKFAHYLSNRLGKGRKEEENQQDYNDQDPLAEPNVVNQKQRRHSEEESVHMTKKELGKKDLDEENILKIETAIQLIQAENEK